MSRSTEHDEASARSAARYINREQNSRFAGGGGARRRSRCFCRAVIGDDSATAVGNTGGNATSALGGTDNAGSAVGAEASEAQCLAHSARDAAVCFICGQVDPMAASAADTLMAIVGPIAPSGMVQT